MSELPDKICVQVVYPNGEIVWEYLKEYLTNPPKDTYILKRTRRRDPLNDKHQ